MKALFIKSEGNRKGAFSLIEVVLSLGIFGLLLTGFSVLMSSMLDSSSTVIKTDHSIDTLGALDEWLAQRDFANVYEWTRQGSKVYLYSFRASKLPPTAEGDDYLVSDAVDMPASINGLDFVLHTALRPEGDPKLEEEIGAIDGPLYQVNLRTASDNPGGPTLPADLATFTGAYIAVRADVYEVPGRGVAPGATTKPVASIPIVVNRK